MSELGRGQFLYWTHQKKFVAPPTQEVSECNTSFLIQTKVQNQLARLPINDIHIYESWLNIVRIYINICGIPGAVCANIISKYFWQYLHNARNKKVGKWKSLHWENALLPSAHISMALQIWTTQCNGCKIYDGVVLVSLFKYFSEILAQRDFFSLHFICSSTCSNNQMCLMIYIFSLWQNAAAFDHC